jgi:hypothetical protein
LIFHVSESGIAVCPSRGPSKSVFESRRTPAGPSDDDYKAAFDQIYGPGSTAPSQRTGSGVADRDLAVFGPADAPRSSRDRDFDEAFSKAYNQF